MTRLLLESRLQAEADVHSFATWLPSAGNSSSRVRTTMLWRPSCRFLLVAIVWASARPHAGRHVPASLRMLAPAGELCWSSRCETTDSDTQGGAVWRGHSRCWETERRKGPTRSVLTQTDGRRRSDSMRVGHASEIQTETLRLTFSSSDPHARACSRGRSG